LEKKEKQSNKPTSLQYKELELILNDLGFDDFDGDSHLEFDLGLDSIDAVNIISSLNQKFNIEISEINFDKCKKVSDISDLIIKTQNYKGSSLGQVSDVFEV
jgi:acyl carrier protein